MRIVRFLDDQGHEHLGRIPATTPAPGTSSPLPPGEGRVRASSTRPLDHSVTGPLSSTSGEVELLSGQLFGTLTPTGKMAKIARLLAPVQPLNIICVGLNYREHARESNSPIPQYPVLFMKPTTALNDPGQPVRIPKCCTRGPEVDYEVELAVVISRTCRDVSEAEALQYVAGYTIANDVSARKWQRNNGGQWVRGKGFDTFCPLGPCLVTPAPGTPAPGSIAPGTPAPGILDSISSNQKSKIENQKSPPPTLSSDDFIPDPQSLRLTTRLNGQIMQDSSTSDMIFSVSQIISFISRDNTLLPGTVILTGTPPGVGFARTPEVFLQPGDHLELEIERIGILHCPIV